MKFQDHLKKRTRNNFHQKRLKNNRYEIVLPGTLPSTQDTPKGVVTVEYHLLVRAHVPWARGLLTLVDSILIVCLLFIRFAFAFTAVDFGTNEISRITNSC